MEINLFHFFFLCNFFIYKDNFWINNFKLESFKIIPISRINNFQMVINGIINVKPFYISIRSLKNVYFYTKFIKKNKSWKFMFLIFKFIFNLKYINTVLFDIIFFWKNYSFVLNKIFKFFQVSSTLNYFIFLRDTKRIIFKYTYLNFFFIDFHYMLTNTVLVFYFKNLLNFSLFIKFFKTLLFERFSLKKKI